MPGTLPTTWPSRSSLDIARSRITIDLAAAGANARRLGERLGRGELWAVVKADGYGHGAAAVAGAALEAGATGLAVATLAEAVALREVHRAARILILSPLAPGEEAGVAGFEVVISSHEGARRLAGLDVAVHVKVDTGMGRWGLAPAEALDLGRRLAGDASRPRLAGLMSHLATAEEPDTTFARRQIDAFRELADVFPPCPRHIANSAATLRLPDALFDGGRCGIALYGVAPDDGDPARDGLTPVLSWASHVAAVRELPPGASSGYGRRLVAAAPTRIALVPVGYADGYPRVLSGRSSVLIGGRRCPVEATISMDALAATLPPDLEVEVGEPVVLIGRQGDERVRAEELARLAGTIGYEVVCGLRARPERSERVLVAPT